jgi:hypothetical protein
MRIHNIFWGNFYTWLFLTKVYCYQSGAQQSKFQADSRAHQRSEQHNSSSSSSAVAWALQQRLDREQEESRKRRREEEQQLALHSQEFVQQEFRRHQLLAQQALRHGGQAAGDYRRMDYAHKFR